MLILLLMTLMLTPSPQVARVEVGIDSEQFFRFDWDGKDSDGRPYVTPIVKVQFRYINPQDINDRHWVMVDFAVNPGETKIPVKEALKGIRGGDWDMQAAILDSSGQISFYTDITDETRLTVITTRPSTVSKLGLFK